MVCQKADCPWQRPSLKATRAQSSNKTTGGGTHKSLPRGYKDKTKNKEKKKSRQSSQNSKDPRPRRALRLLQAMVCAAAMCSVASCPCLPSVQSYNMHPATPCVSKRARCLEDVRKKSYEASGEWPILSPKLLERVSCQTVKDVPKHNKSALHDS